MDVTASMFIWKKKRRDVPVRKRAAERIEKQKEEELGGSWSGGERERALGGRGRGAEAGRGDHKSGNVLLLNARGIYRETKSHGAINKI